jgi:Ca-activated chloride channel family protein
MYDERRLEFVIDAVKFLSNNVAPDDRVALVAFADRAKVILDSNQIHDKAAVQRALDDIDLLEIGGGTQMALGMQAAIDEVNKGHAPNRLNRVLVLTDGQTYQETACTDLATKYREAMSFSTMGVGEDRAGLQRQVSLHRQPVRDPRTLRR